MLGSPSSGWVPATLPASRPWEPRRTFVATLGDRYGRRTLARSRDAPGRTRDVRRERQGLAHHGEGHPPTACGGTGGGPTIEGVLSAAGGYRSIVGLVKHVAGWSAVYHSYAFDDQPRQW